MSSKWILNRKGQWANLWGLEDKEKKKTDKDEDEEEEEEVMMKKMYWMTSKVVISRYTLLLQIISNENLRAETRNEFKFHDFGVYVREFVYVSLFMR
jgi:hypothetical protein